MLSGEPTPRPFSWRGWRTRPWMKLLSGTTLQPSTASLGVELWIQSLVASLALTSQLQEKVRESKRATDQDSSLNTSGLFAKYSPDGFLSKTCQVSLLMEQCQPYLENFPKWGSMRNGECFQQKTWAPVINARESLSWPTPRTQEPGRTREGYGRGLSELVEGKEQIPKFWPTPLSSEHAGGTPEIIQRRRDQGRQIMLCHEARIWFTSIISDQYNTVTTDKLIRKDGKCRLDKLSNMSVHTGPLAQTKQTSGSDSSKSVQTSPQQLKRLSPTFVEWLMGLPTGWSLPIPINQNDYKFWETESCRLLELLLLPHYLKD